MVDFYKKLVVVAIIALILIITVFFIIFPNFFANGCRTFIDIGEYNDVKYVYGYGDLAGVFKKSEIDDDYTKISEYIPLGSEYFYFIDGYAYFTTKGYSLVKLDLNNFQEEICISDSMNSTILGVNNNYLIVNDYNSSSRLKILNRLDYSIVNSFDFITKDCKLDDTSFKFTDYKTKEQYEYQFENNKLVIY